MSLEVGALVGPKEGGIAPLEGGCPHFMRAMLEKKGVKEKEISDTARPSGWHCTRPGCPMEHTAIESGMRRKNLSLTKWWWWCRSCAAYCHTRGISAEAEAAGRGDTRGWPLNIGKTIAAGNTHTSLLDRCYVVNVFVSTTVAFFQQRALLVGVGTTQS